jgi:hypothetical protein
MVFRALIDRNDFQAHRPLAQLSYILDDPANRSQTEEALRLINRAIEIRDRAGVDGHFRYELHHASCLIQLDRNFSQERQSDAEIKQRVVSDLKRALVLEDVRKELLKAVADLERQARDLDTDKPFAYRTVASWLLLNNVKWDDIWPPGMPVPSLEPLMSSE